MKIKIKIIAVLILFYSCNDNLNLKFPQPIYLENIEKIPNNFQGSFERIDDKDTIRYKLFETFGLIDNDSLKLGSDKFIVKHQNNNLFVLSRFNYFKTDSILIKTLSLNTSKIHAKNDDSYILNYMLINNISFIDSDPQSDEYNFPEPLEDTLNVNQINSLLNWDRYAYRLKFNKH